MALKGLKKRSEENVEVTAVAKEKQTAKVVETVKAAKPKPHRVLFVSAKEETQQFDVVVAGKRINSMWNKDREFLIWRVPAELADRFSRHEFVVKGRIIRED